MNAQPDFPVHATHAEAAEVGCSQCHAKLDPSSARLSYYPPRRGEWVIYCQSCGIGYWYDLPSTPTGGSHVPL